METRHRILLVDDDTALLKTYSGLLSQLPSHPEIHTAKSGPRALTMLEQNNYRLLLCDLKMPKMDGLQILSIVRRKFPELRTVALTGVVEEQFRSRAYGMGVDLFWHKPNTEQEIRMFLECIESFLGREADEPGFRGVQSKSLMDIIQLECISQSSSVLRISNGPTAGRIWIQEGEVVDAETGELVAEAAFQRVLSWRNGSFEMLPPEASRPRTIFKSYSALLLESAQVIDESREKQTGVATDPSPLNRVAHVDGIEFVLAMKQGETTEAISRGLENPQRVTAWAHESLKRFRTLGERLQVGALEQVSGFGPQRHISMGPQGAHDLCVGWRPNLTLRQLQDGMRTVKALWAS
jgi:CheY-like chemotaxis protein